MPRDWTPGQQKAINTRGCDLLVSAGAGSGKTAVLTERIIQRLTSETDPADITGMLVVTFTKAAAGELKERIGAAISEALAKQPKNKRLARQLTALDRAKISTIHSFCLDILKENPSASGLPQSFRIADSAEITLLRKSIMNELIEDLYETPDKDCPIRNFADFADNFVGTKNDDSLCDIFLGIENKLSSFTEHIDFIASSAKLITDSAEDFSASPFAAEIFDLIKGKFTLYRDALNAAMPDVLDSEKCKKAYAEAFTSDIDYCTKVIEAADAADYIGLTSAANAYTSVPIGRLQDKDLTPAIIRAKDARKAFGDERKKLCAKFFSLDGAKLSENCIKTADMLMKLHTLLAQFLRRFNAEKLARGILDFGDLERMAYKLLVSDGKPTDIAKAIAERFDEIYIDEYQDVNSVQDAVFSAVSKGNNRFMVGDIKQSIYSFRGAEPHIFNNYRNSFGASEGGENTGTAVFLSDNFRCDDTVIRLTNIVSECLFTGGRGDIPFLSEDKLIHSKKDTESGENCKLVLISGKAEKPSSEDEDDGEAVEGDISATEARYIATEVKKLLKHGKKNNGEPIRPGDIAILMRSVKAASKALEDAFAENGIPFHNGESMGFFENAEVLLALCILNVIDNPTRDIYLAGALRSPVFGFSLDDLILIRRHSPEGSLYGALKAYAADKEDKKCIAFLETLEKWRDFSVGQPVDRLLWYIYGETDLPALVYDRENEVRRANLMLLYEYARIFEASSFKGLYNFIRYVSDIIEEKAQLEAASVSSEDSDSVKLMTIHHSKGLEFPVCFIAGTGKRFNTMDLRENIIIERSLGIALKLSDTTGFARYDTPVRQALIKRLEDSLLEEEMRVLYVAMTRARERLYVTAEVEDPEKFRDACLADAEKLSRYTVMRNGGYMKWILTALEHYGLRDEPEPPATVECISFVGGADETVDEEAEVCKATSASDDLLSLVRERFDFKYPKSSAARLPAKLSVSKLVPNLLDDDTAELPEPKQTYSFSDKKPKFLDGAADTASTGAERGTATHLFMQFCDFGRFADFNDDIAETVKDEAARLASRHFVTRRMSELISIDQLTTFFEGETFAAICAAKKVWREHRFNVKLPASDFTEDPSLAKELASEKVLVQGVIDCFFENSDGTLTLIDYKTDYVPSSLSDTDADNMLLERHRMQLLYYKAALEKISARKVSRVAIYSFTLGREITVE